jgi:tetratricopeptide (TPR) repeat protein
VIGEQFWWSAVVDLAPAEMRDRVGAQLHALVRKRLIEPAETTMFAGEDSFRFEHILVRDAAYATLPKMARAEMHESFADWLEQRTVDQPEILGHHLEQAYIARAELGRPDEATQIVAARAGAMLARAGRRAFAREDMPAAARMLGRAVALLHGGEERREALRERSAALWVIGERESADRLLDELLTDALAAGDARLEWHARLDQAGRTVTRDGLDTVAREAVDVFETLGDDIGLARAWRRISLAAALRGTYDDAAKASERALMHARAAGDAPEEARNVDRLCTALLFGPTPAREGIQRCEELLRKSGADTLLDANVLCSLSGLQAFAGELEAARSSYGRARAIYETLGLRLLIAGLTGITGAIELLAGNPAVAEAELRLGADILSELGHSAGLAVQAALLAEASYAQGERAEADLWALRAQEVAPPNDLQPQVLWRCVRAKLLGGAGVEVAAEAVALVAPTDAVNLHADARATLATALRAAGREQDAAVEAREALELYERKGNVLAARALVAEVV